MSSLTQPRPAVLLSAHRGGCGRSPAVENTLAAFVAAVSSGVEYVEFDVQRTCDGHYLIHHDDRVYTLTGFVPFSSLTAYEVDMLLGERVRYLDVLALLAEAGCKAHLDFKFTSPVELYEDPASCYEVEAVELARTFFADSDYIVTSAADESVRVVRDWADAQGFDVLVGLSIGRHRLTGMSVLGKACWRVGEMWPGRRILESRANLVVAQRHLARVRLLAWAARHDLPVLVWTVDSPREMRRLLGDSRVWMVTSNFPERGLTLRGALASLASATSAGAANPVSKDRAT